MEEAGNRARSPRGSRGSDLALRLQDFKQRNNLNELEFYYFYLYCFGDYEGQYKCAFIFNVKRFGLFGEVILAVVRLVWMW